MLYDIYGIAILTVKRIADLEEDVMAAPLKPWEVPGVNRLQSTPTAPSNNMSGTGNGGLPPCCTGGGGASPASNNPPPVPTRPTQSSMYRSPMSYGSGYGMNSMYGSSYGMGMYGSPYNSYGSYGGYGMYGGLGGYNRMGDGVDDYNSFARQAEENSRHAFQSVESIVYAVSSVSMMLESTYQAVFNSFRAVIGVADNFTRLKIQLAQVFSAFALYRTLRYLWRKLMVLLRLRPAGYADEAWSQASDTVMDNLAEQASKDPKKTTWPIFVFFGIILGTPWLIWKLISKITQPPGKGWASGEEDHFIGTGLYDFQTDNPNEVSFKAGQTIRIAPKELQPRMKGWMLASVDGKKIGIIPANYIKVQGKKRGLRNVDPTASLSVPSGINPPPPDSFNNCPPEQSFNETRNSRSQINSTPSNTGKSCCKSKNTLSSIKQDEDILENSFGGKALDSKSSDKDLPLPPTEMEAREILETTGSETS